MATEPRMILQRSTLREQLLAQPSRRTPRLLNPSAKPGEIQLHIPVSSITADPTGQQLHQYPEADVQVVEFDSSRTLQPFLDGERILKGLRDLRTDKVEGSVRMESR